MLIAPREKEKKKLVFGNWGPRKAQNLCVCFCGHVVPRQQETPLSLYGGASGDHGVADVGLPPGWGDSCIPRKCSGQRGIQPPH